MKKNDNIIITLDDFGISPETNQKFFEILDSCQVERVSVMTNGNVSPEDAKRLLSYEVKLDVHLDLRKTALNEGEVGKNVFKRISLFIARLPFSGKPDKIEKLWEQQILEFKKIFGKNPDGLNSHEHVHYFPPYTKKIISLSKKHGVKFMRFGTESYCGKNIVSGIICFLKKIGPGNENIPTTHIMASFDWISNFDSFTRSLGDEKKAEISFHPALKKEYSFLKEKFGKN